MTDQERDIWNAAYAAAFVAKFEKYSRMRFDDGAKHTSAEEPVVVADLAVTRLREWRLNERPEAGIVVPELPPE